MSEKPPYIICTHAMHDCETPKQLKAATQTPEFQKAIEEAKKAPSQYGVYGSIKAAYVYYMQAILDGMPIPVGRRIAALRGECQHTKTSPFDCKCERPPAECVHKKVRDKHGK